MDEEHVDRMLRSGVTAFNWTVCSPHAGLRQALHEIQAAREFIAARPDRLLLIERGRDLDVAKATDRVGLIFGPQNALPLAESADAAETLYEHGVRIVQLTYNERNVFGDGCTVSRARGLTVRGQHLVKQLNAMGVVVDLSHAHETTMLEAIEVSARPVIVSHANARAVFDSPRNVNDEVLHALKRRGGVIGLTFWSPMVGGDGEWPAITHFLRHVEHVVELVGPRHVGIGSDHSEGHPRHAWDELYGRAGRYPTVAGLMGDWYGYDTRFAQGAGSCEDMPRIAEALADIGFGDEDLQGILGGNFRRVFEEVWR